MMPAARSLQHVQPFSITVCANGVQDAQRVAGRRGIP